MHTIQQLQHPGYWSSLRRSLVGLLGVPVLSLRLNTLLLGGRKQQQWRNEGPRRPAVRGGGGGGGGGHNLTGAQNHRSNVGQFEKT